MACCYYAADLTTDAQGEFEVRTIRPATKPEPGGEVPGHIHLATGTLGSSGRDVVLLFSDDPDLVAHPPEPMQAVISVTRQDSGELQAWSGWVQVVVPPPA
jgi:hypothetical protein